MFGQNDNQKPDDSAQSAPEPVADGLLGDSPSPSSQTDSVPTGPGDTTNSSTADNPATNDNSVKPALDDLVKSSDDDELLNIKQQALQQLSPLVGHLDQSPEEKFRTFMMMIQASDDQELLKTAYAAAKEISDEKARAQALLDIINEINYFTQEKQ